jgi:hypothetical protein
VVHVAVRQNDVRDIRERQPQADHLFFQPPDSQACARIDQGDIAAAPKEVDIHRPGLFAEHGQTDTGDAGMQMLDGHRSDPGTSLSHAATSGTNSSTRLVMT